MVSFLGEAFFIDKEFLKQDVKVNAVCENCLGQSAERIEEQRKEYFLFKAFFETSSKSWCANFALSEQVFILLLVQSSV